MNCLLVNALLATGQLKSGQEYDFDFDHQFIETEKYDAKPTYKKFLGYSPGVAVINDMIVGIENRDGNTNVRFNQRETLERIFKRLEASEVYISRARMDCGSCSEEIVDMIEAHCKHFYIRANRCSSFYDSMFALTGWKTVEINGIEFELNSILVEKWKGKPYRLVIQRQRRIEGDLDIWEGEYTYRCILTNDYKSSARDIVEFYNLRGGKERIFDDMNNGFGWNQLPKSFMAQNTVFLLMTALIISNVQQPCFCVWYFCRLALSASLRAFPIVPLPPQRRVRHKNHGAPGGKKQLRHHAAVPQPQHRQNAQHQKHPAQKHRMPGGGIAFPAVTLHRLCPPFSRFCPAYAAAERIVHKRGLW